MVAMKFLAVILGISTAFLTNLANAQDRFFLGTTEEVVSIPKVVSILGKNSNKNIKLETSINATLNIEEVETPEDTHNGIFRGYVLHIKKSAYTSELPDNDILAVERNGWTISRNKTGILEVKFSNPRIQGTRVSQAESRGGEDRCRFGGRAFPNNLNRIGSGTLDYALKQALSLNKYICIERF